MLKSRVKKRIAIFLVSAMIVPLILSLFLSGSSVTAAEATAGSGGTKSNAMARSMIDFFKTKNEFNPSRLSQDEAKVWGVFLSNFYIPWHTTLSDLIKEPGTGENGSKVLVEKLSDKFFKNEGQASTFLTLNQLLYKAIYSGLESSNRTFALYSSPEAAQANTTPLSGEELLKKIMIAQLIDSKAPDNKEVTSGETIKGKDSYLYMNKNGASVPVINLNDKATKAAFRVLMSLSPEMFLASGKGMRDIESLYLDGVGNIWGRKKGDMSFQNVILVMPSALNPITFAGNLDLNNNSLKFPMANTFVMGSLLRINAGDFTNGKDKFLPYYNVPTPYMSVTNQLISYYGVHSPSNKLGNSDAIFKGGGNIPLSDIKDFVERDSEVIMSMDNAKIFMNVNIAGNSFLTDTAFETKKSGNFNGYTADAAGALVSYLTESTVFSLNSIADDMYYFTNPWVVDSRFGDLSLDAPDALYTKQRLFTKGVYDESSKKYSDSVFSFYVSANAMSPFGALLFNYSKLDTDTKKEDFLNVLFSDSKVEYSSLVGGLGKGEYGVNKATKKDIKDFLDFLTFDSRFYGNPADNVEGSTPTDYTSATKTYKYPKDAVNSLNNALIQTAKILSQSNSKSFIGGSFLPKSDSTVKYDTGKSWYSFFTSIGRYRTMASSFAEGDSVLQELSSVGSLPYEAWDNRVKSGHFAPTVYNLFEGHMGYTTSVVDKNIAVTDIPNDEIRSLVANFMVYEVFGVQANMREALSGSKIGDSYSTLWGEGNEVVLRNPIANETNNFIGIYWGYIVGLLGADKDKIGQLLQLDNKYLPFMVIDVQGSSFSLDDLFATAGATADENSTDEVIARDLLRKLYSFMNDGGSTYRDKLIKSTQDSWIISTHHSIVGSWVGKDFSVAAGGNSAYGSVVGFINTPSLLDLPLTAWLLSDYLSVYIFIMVITLILAVLMVVTNTRTIRDGLATLIVMAFLLLLPQFLLTNVIGITNGVSDKIFSDRFNYWAIVQHEQSLRGINKAASTGDPLEYRIALSADAMTNAYNPDSGVTVRWMAPKRYDVFGSIATAQNWSQQLQSNLGIFRWLFANYLTQDEYVSNDPMATYLYRPYNTIVQEARANQKNLTEASFSKSGVMGQIENRIAGFTGIPDGRFSKFFGTPPLTLPSETQKRVDVAAPLTPGDSDSAKAKVELYRYWWLSSVGINDAIFNSDIDDRVGYSGSLDDPAVRGFTLITESPFYYFYSALSSRSVSGRFKSDLLNEKVFKVTGSGGESYNNQIRDFLDLEGLFTYVIPYLSQANDYVYRYTDKYGMTAKDMTRVEKPEEPKAGDADYAKKMGIYNDYLLAEKHKANLQAAWLLYTPWVDQLYSTSFSSGRYSTLGKSTFLEDTLNPSSYELSGRPMIFSPADMRAKNASVDALSTVEYKMQNVLKKTYTDLMYLVNYYDFNDEVLLAAAAMSATFNFNSEFSEKRILGESSMLYPQGYELRNFNYDAFLRLILLNSTGEPMMSDEDLYVRVINKTSFITGIVLLISDILNVIVVPAMKMAVLFLLFIMIFIMVLNGMITPPDKIFGHLWKKVLSPVLWFVVVSIGFSVLVSLIMGEGLTGYVGARAPSLGMTDPTITLTLLVLVSLVFIFFLFIMSMKFFKVIRDEGTALFASTAGMVASAGSGLLGKVAKFAGLKMLLGGGNNTTTNITNYGSVEKKKSLLGRVAGKLRRTGRSYNKGTSQDGGSSSPNEETKKIDALADTNNQAGEPTTPQVSDPSPPETKEPMQRHQAKVHYRKDGSIDVQMKVYTPSEITELREKKKAEKEAAKTEKAAKLAKTGGSAASKAKSRKRKKRSKRK